MIKSSKTNWSGKFLNWWLINLKFKVLRISSIIEWQIKSKIKRSSNNRNTEINLNSGLLSIDFIVKIKARRIRIQDFKYRQTYLIGIRVNHLALKQYFIMISTSVKISWSDPSGYWWENFSFKSTGWFKIRTSLQFIWLKNYLSWEF